MGEKARALRIENLILCRGFRVESDGTLSIEGFAPLPLELRQRMFSVTVLAVVTGLAGVNEFEWSIRVFLPGGPTLERAGIASRQLDDDKHILASPPNQIPVPVGGVYTVEIAVTADGQTATAVATLDLGLSAPSAPN